MPRRRRRDADFEDLDLRLGEATSDRTVHEMPIETSDEEVNKVERTFVRCVKCDSKRLHIVYLDNEAMLDEKLTVSFRCAKCGTQIELNIDKLIEERSLECWECVGFIEHIKGLILDMRGVDRKDKVCT